MAETPRVAAPVGSSLDQLLLDTKLAIPRPRAGVVSRADLIASGIRSGCRVVALTAPSGYGKSSLLAEWADAEERRVIWASLDRFDDDPAALLFLLASAFVRATGADPALIADMRRPDGSLLGRAAPRLAGALRTCPDPFVLILDDLHELASPACHDILSVVIRGIPAESQLVAASRFEQPHVPRLRSSGDVLELGVDEMALDAAGVRHIFAAEQVEIDSQLASSVADRTEGWAVGIHLAAMIARRTHDVTVALSGNDRYVADYLYRESLAGLPEDVQRFLRRTAVLDQFSAELCDAILDEDGAQGRLRELEASNVFLIPLDRYRDWYRYHPLFREFLVSELRRTEPGLIVLLHSRAADWYESNGSPALAIEHLLATTDVERCVRLATEVALFTYQIGQMETVHRWIRALGEEVVVAYPPLAVVAGWIGVMSGHSAEAARWAELVEKASFDLPPADGTASFASGRAMLRSMMCASGPDQAMADALFGLAEESDSSPWRDQALCLVAEASLLTGDVHGAESMFVAAGQVSLSTGNHDVSVLSGTERALILMDRGRWVEATGLVEAAMTMIDDHRLDDYAFSVLTFAAAGRLALHRGEPAKAELELTRAMRARQFCTSAAPALAVRARLGLAKSYFAIGDSATARHLMHEVEDVLLCRPALGSLVDDVAAFRSLLDATTTVTSDAPPLTPAELRLLPYLQTHLTIPEIGARLFVSRNTVSTEVGSIYRKLGVSSRSDAVERAMAVGLLGE